MNTCRLLTCEEGKVNACRYVYQIIERNAKEEILQLLDKLFKSQFFAW